MDVVLFAVFASNRELKFSELELLAAQCVPAPPASDDGCAVAMHVVVVGLIVLPCIELCRLMQK